MAGAGLIRLGGRRVAHSRFLVLERDYLMDAEGRWVTREVVRHPGSVVVIPWGGEAVALIEQYRHAAGHAILEFPAGKLDVAGESPEDAARRECAEEMGLEPVVLTRLHGSYASPGFTDEYSHVFLAEGLVPIDADPQGIEEERARIVWMSPEEIAEGLSTGRFEDAKTILGLYALLDHLR